MKFKKLLLETIVAVSTLVGCASNSSNTRIQKKDYDSQYTQSRFDYKLTDVADEMIIIVAGIYAGTMKATEQVDNFHLEGTYGQRDHPKAMIRALSDADTNSDKKIDFKEVDTLLKGILKYQEKEEPVICNPTLSENGCTLLKISLSSCEKNRLYQEREAQSVNKGIQSNCYSSFKEGTNRDQCFRDVDERIKESLQNTRKKYTACVKGAKSF
jgi:hypothetical protein